MSLPLSRDGAAQRQKTLDPLLDWIPDQVGDDTKGKNRYDEIPRMTMMVRLAPHSGNE